MDGLAEEHGAVDQRKRGNEVRDQDRARRAGPREQRVVEDVPGARAADAEREHRTRDLPAREARRQLHDRERQQGDRRGRERADGAHERLDGHEGSRAVDRRDRVAEGRERDGERRDDVAARLDAHEERDPAEADQQPEQPRSADPVVARESEGEQGSEERRGGLDHSRQPGIDPGLRPRDRGDR